MEILQFLFHDLLVEEISSGKHKNDFIFASDFQWFVRFQDLPGYISFRLIYILKSGIHFEIYPKYLKVQFVLEIIF